MSKHLKTIAVTPTEPTAPTESIDLIELRESLDLLQNDIEDVQTLWEQVEAYCITAEGLTGNEQRRFTALIRMLTDSIDRAAFQVDCAIEELKA